MLGMQHHIRQTFSGYSKLSNALIAFLWNVNLWESPCSMIDLYRKLTGLVTVRNESFTVMTHLVLSKSQMQPA